MPKEIDPPLSLQAGGLRQVGLHVEHPLSHPVHSQGRNFAHKLPKSLSHLSQGLSKKIFSKFLFIPVQN